jgi:hypothetical protein
MRAAVGRELNAQPINVLVLGASGMVATAVLRECLVDGRSRRSRPWDAARRLYKVQNSNISSTPICAATNPLRPRNLAQRSYPKTILEARDIRIAAGN